MAETIASLAFSADGQSSQPSQPITGLTVVSAHWIFVFFMVLVIGFVNYLALIEIRTSTSSEAANGQKHP
jgi:hypothetical protein